MTNECNENELGIQFVSFKCTSSKCITSAIRMNYCNKHDLLIEVLIRVSINDAIEHECELASVKEMLKNVEVNKRKVFRNRTKNWENKNNVLLIMHVSMMSQVKNWVRNNYGTMCLFVDKIENEQTKNTWKVNEVEECLIEEISSRKNKIKKQHGIWKNNMCFPEEVRNNELINDEEEGSDDSNEDSSENQGKEEKVVDMIMNMKSKVIKIKRK